MRGKVFRGATVMGSPGVKVFIRVMHMRRGLPLISALQEPHLPALQFHRTARSPACVAWMAWMTSSTTIPSWAGRRYSVKAAPLASQRQVPGGVELAAAAHAHAADTLREHGDLLERLPELALVADDADERLHAFLEVGMDRVRVLVARVLEGYPDGAGRRLRLPRVHP